MTEPEIAPRPGVGGLGVRRLDRDLRGRLEVNHASVTTVGILTGIIFLAFGAEQLLLATIDHRGRYCGRSSAGCSPQLWSSR